MTEHGKKLVVVGVGDISNRVSMMLNMARLHGLTAVYLDLETNPEKLNGLEMNMVLVDEAGEPRRSAQMELPPIWRDPKPKAKHYGPVRKGKGGKERRWQ